MTHPDRACLRSQAKVFASAKEAGFPPAKTRIVSYRARCWIVRSAEADNPLDETIVSAALYGGRVGHQCEIVDQKKSKTVRAGHVQECRNLTYERRFQHIADRNPMR
jgi:hypothetical protein